MLQIDSNTGKPEVVLRICEARGWSFNPYFPPSLKAFSDKLLAEDAESSALPRRLFGREETIAGGHTVPFRAPTLLNGFPKAFGVEDPNPRTLTAPAFKVLHVRNGTLGLVNDAPVVFDSERHIHPVYSSFYYPILPHMGDGHCLKLDEAIEIDGRAIVMMDDVGGVNYSHWLCDWLPRLTALSTVLEDTYVVVLSCKTSWQLETLRACGFPPRRIVSLTPWQAVRARELIVPSYLSEVLHPAYRGARWALDFLDRKLDTLPGELTDAPRRVYFSRADARVRRIANEEAFAAYLEALDYQTFTASDLSVAAQARLFRSATSIVSLHGAGLTNVVFCKPGCKVLEIVPENYGMPTFWILANGKSVDFATYIATSLKDENINQAQNVIIDIEHFDEVARHWLSS